MVKAVFAVISSELLLQRPALTIATWAIQPDDTEVWHEITWFSLLKIIFSFLLKPCDQFCYDHEPWSCPQPQEIFPHRFCLTCCQDRTTWNATTVWGSWEPLSSKVGSTFRGTERCVRRNGCSCCSVCLLWRRQTLPSSGHHVGSSL